MTNAKYLSILEEIKNKGGKLDSEEPDDKVLIIDGLNTFIRCFSAIPTLNDDGAEVVVDDVSYEFVRGATIDYVDEMIKSSFEVVKNPQADASCGCGASFGAKESAFGALGGQT